MSENLGSDIEKAQQTVPNTAIDGVNDAKDKNYNPFPTINMILGKPNTTVQFKYDATNKTLYTVQAEDWNPTHLATLDLYKQAGKKYKQRPEETAEQKVMDGARFPDHTFKYFISYTVFKRMMGADGEEYLVRYGYLHGISIMNLEWKFFKQDFDFHYEPVFEPKVGNQSNYFQMTYGEEINQVKKYHTKWDKETFEKSLRDIPYPTNAKIGITFKVGVEGSLGVTSIPSLDAFKTKSFADLYEYARTGDREYLQVAQPQPTSKKK